MNTPMVKGNKIILTHFLWLVGRCHDLGDGDWFAQMVTRDQNTVASSGVGWLSR